MVRQKLLTILLSILLALFLLSGSIACPILVRGLYYFEVDRYELPAETGYSRDTILKAYDEMMDYCTGGGEAAGKVFGTGTLAWSESGKSHFDDVEKLFRLDFWIMGISGGLLLLYLCIRLILRVSRKKPSAALQPYRFLHRGPLFWGPVGLLVCAGILGGIAALDFDAFFVSFHHLFFPGKENWIFSPDKDAIIRVLPENIFADFALVILCVLALGCIICIMADLIHSSQIKRKASAPPLSH